MVPGGPGGAFPAHRRAHFAYPAAVGWKIDSRRRIRAQTKSKARQAYHRLCAGPSSDVGGPITMLGIILTTGCHDRGIDTNLGTLDSSAVSA